MDTFSDIAMGCGTCCECLAIIAASLAGGLNWAGAGGIEEYAVVGADMLSVAGDLDGAGASLVSLGVFSRLSIAVNREMEIDLVVVWLAGTGCTSASQGREEEKFETRWEWWSNTLKKSVNQILTGRLHRRSRPRTHSKKW